jgi:hypothetical protein
MHQAAESTVLEGASARNAGLLRDVSSVQASSMSNSAIRSMAHFGPGLFAVGNPGTLQTTAFVVQRESSALRHADEVGVYLRLVKDAQRKQAALEAAIDCIKRGETDSRVYEYRQGNFVAIPGSPWVYWITPSLRQLFANLPKLKDLAQPRVGLQTGTNGRFLRFWWEQGLSRLGKNCADSSEAVMTQKRWFPSLAWESGLLCELEERWCRDQGMCPKIGRPQCRVLLSSRSNMD